MNTGIYRLVFNAEHGILVPAGEYASARRCGRRSHRPSAVGKLSNGHASPPWFAARASAFAVLCAFGMQPFAAEAQATLPMVPDRSGANHPVVGVSASGVPLVNIVTPNQAGVSLNHFTHYNVGTNGAVIVNTPRSAQSQIAGWVQGNPLMGNTPARLIINQVTTGNPTRLLGVTEIAGNRANLIVANPAGITCAGCGFINIPRVSLTTGRPSFNRDGSLAGFDVAKGRLAIDGAGLDARGSAIDLIARAMQINGQVWADTIRSTAGANHVSYADGTATVRPGEGDAPAVAIDVQALGGMYANSVRLIGTEAGVGVRSSGVVDSLTGDIELSAKGDVAIVHGGRIQAAGDARIDAPNVTNEGAIVSGRTVRLDAGSTLRNEGTIAAQSNVTLAAATVDNAAHILAGLDASGELSAPGSVSLTGDVLSSNGTLAAGDNVNLKGSAVSLDGGVISAASALNVDADERLTTRGAIANSLNATLHSEGEWINDGGMIVAVDGARIDARSASNLGGTVVGETLSLKTGDLRNVGGNLLSLRRSEISTANLDNVDGSIGARRGALHLSASGSLFNDRGHIIGGDGLWFDISRLASNRDGKIGIVAGDGGIRIAFDANNDHGTILSGQRLKVIVDGRITNGQGSIVGGDGLELQTRSIESNAGGEIGSIGGRASILVHDALNNVDGGVRSGGALSVRGAALDNRDGEMRGSELDLNVASLKNDGGMVVAVGTAEIQAEKLSNQGGFIGALDGTLSASVSAAIDNTQGAMLAGGDVKLAGSGFVNTQGTVSGTDVGLNMGEAAIVNTLGTIGAKGRLESESGAFDNRSGLIQASDSATVDTHSNRFDNHTAEGATAGGSVIANGVVLTTGALDNTGGVISSSDTTQVRAPSISNDRGAILSLGKLDAESAGPISNVAGQIGSNADVTMSGTTIDNTRGGVHAGETLTVTGDAIVNGQTKETALAPVLGLPPLQAGMEAATVSVTARSHIENTEGSIRSDEKTHLIAQSIENTRGVASSSGRLSIDANQTLTNVDGDVLGGQAINMAAGALDNRGRIESSGRIEVETRGDLNNSGDIRAGGDLRAAAGGNVGNSGSMTARGVAEVAGKRIHNAASGEIVGNTKTGVLAESVSNEGLIDGTRTLVKAKDTAENAGRIYGDWVSVGAQTVRNRADANGAGAAMASRGDIDIGASVIENESGSLIYASNDIRTGATLDANENASENKSARIKNVGSVIDAGGNLSIATDRFENLNARFETEKITTDSGRQLWYTVPGSTERIDSSAVYFYQRNSEEARPGTDYGWALDDDQKTLLLPSAQYPFAEYAKYTMNGIAGKIDRVHYPNLAPFFRNADGIASDPAPAGVFRTVPAEMWAKFGIEPPPLPPEPSLIKPADFRLTAWGHQRHLGADWYTLSAPIAQPRQDGAPPTQVQFCAGAATERCTALNEWHKSLTRSYGALSRAINDYNQNVASRIVSTWNIYDVQVKSTKDIVTATQPGIVTAGREMTISAHSGINDKSQMVAGGRQYLNDAIQDNSQPKGTESFEGVGKAIHTWIESGGAFRGDDRKQAIRGYAAPLPPREIDLPVAVATPTNLDPIKRIAADVAVMIGTSDIRVAGAAAQSIQAPGGDPTRTIAASGGLLGTTGSPTAMAQAKLGTIEIRMIEPNIKLPNNALYRVVADPGSRYLIETDPRFTNRKAWLSSEQMIGALRVDPGSVQKRLGDGFYEQQLIQQQIVQATGHRLIGNYTDNESAYQALMANGVKAAQRFGMNVGTALTDEQMAALTDDIVWLVNRSVVLPDGSEQTVLVPQVYLRANSADVTGTGSIVAGNDVVVNNEGALKNSGTIASRGITIVTADSITNVGTVAGRSVKAEARQDLINLGGLIQGDAIELSAGRDVRLVSTTQTSTKANGSATELDRVSQINAGTLTARAGRDLDASAAQIVSSGEALLAAKRDVSLTTLRQSSEDHVRWDDKNRSNRSASIDIGTTVQSGGNLGIVAGRDFNATAASASAQGSLSAVAGRDVNLRAGERSASAYDEHHMKESGILSSKSTHTIDASRYTDAVGTLLSGNTVEVVAGNNLTASATTIAGTGDVALEAGNDMTITTAETSSSEYHFKDVKKSGFGTAGAGISHGTNQTIDSSLGTEKGARGSLIGSLGGSVSMRAGNKLRIAGSDVVAAHDVTGVAKEVKVEASQTDRHRYDTHEAKSSGFTLAVKSPVLDALQNLNRQAQGASRSQDSRASALHAIAAAGGVADLAGASGDMARALSDGGKPEAKIELSFGSSRSKSTYTQDSVLNNGSHIKAGGGVAFVATGDKSAGQGNVTIVGSDIVAKDVLLKATNKVNLLNATDSERVRSTNESQSASAGVSFGTNGWGVSAAMSRGKGYANSDATMQTNTHIVASNAATIVSGGDTDIIGANVSAKRVIGEIGGNLNIASVQDTVHSVAQQRSSGGGFSVSQGGGSASFSMSKSDASGSYAGVSEQSGIQAGEGGFDITVKGNTDLKGAYIAGTATPEKNRLTTGTLSFSDIENGSDYRARSAGGSVGGGVGDGGNNYATHGQTAGRNAGGASPMVLSESGSSQALTKSAVSDGSITIMDEGSQRQDIAMLNRDTSNLNGTVDKLPDLSNALANQSDMIDAAQAAAETIAKQIGAYADKKEREALAAAKRETDPTLRESYRKTARDWAEGGDYRVGLHVAGGALTGGLTGGGGGAVGGAVGAGLSAKLAPQLKEIAQSVRDAGPTGNADVDQLLGNLASNVLAGGGGALVGGSTGALTSAATDRFNRQLHQREYDDAKRHAKTVAKELGISEQEAEGRIVAEILRNSDKQTAQASSGKHDYKVRSIVGCQNLNCDGYKNDPRYANHDYNSEYIEPNRGSYDLGQRRLGRGETYNELVTANIKNDPLGATLAGVGLIGLGVSTGGSLAPGGMMGAGALLGLGANGSVQVMGDQPFDWKSFALSGATGALSTGMKFSPVFLTGVGGALTGSALQGQNPNGAMTGAAVGTVIGYPLGSKFESKLQDILNPWYRQEWADVGMGVSKYVPPSTIPSWVGGALGGAAQARTGAAVQSKADGGDKK